MTITTDSISTFHDAAVAAAVTLVPVNTACHPATNGAEGELDMQQAEAIVRDLIRVSRGPIAFVTVHNSNEWSDIFSRNGLFALVMPALFGSVDVVIGSARPIQLPDCDDVCGMSELIESITRAVSSQGETVLVPFASTRIAPMSVKSAGREVIAQAPTTAHLEELQAHTEGRLTTHPLTDSAYADAVERVNKGEGVSRVAKSLGVCVSRLNLRLLRDGHRHRLIRRPRKQRQA